MLLSLASHPKAVALCGGSSNELLANYNNNFFFYLKSKW